MDDYPWLGPRAASSSRDPCPGNDEDSIETSLLNIRFRAHCNKDFRGHDVSNSTKESLKDCANYCATYQGSLCSGAVFKSSNSKCYLKGGDIDSSKLASPDSSDDIVDVLLPSADYSSENDCASLGDTYASQSSGNSTEFTVACDYDITVSKSDIIKTRLYARSMRDCVEECAQDPECQSISYDPNLVTGYQNCWKKKVFSMIALQERKGRKIDSAYLSTDLPSPSGSSSSSADAPSSPAGAIAGGVVGGVAFLVLVAGLIFFMLRRRRKAAAAGQEANEAAGPGDTSQINSHKEMQQQSPLSATATATATTGTPMSGGPPPSELTSGSYPVSNELDGLRPPAEMRGSEVGHFGYPTTAPVVPAELPGSAQDRH